MLLSELEFGGNQSLVLEAESVRSTINSKLSRNPLTTSSSTALKDGSIRMQGSMGRSLSRVSSRNMVRVPSRSPYRGVVSTGSGNSKFMLRHGPIKTTTMRKIRANDPGLITLNCSNLAFNGSVGDPRPTTGNRLGRNGSKALAGALCYNRHIEVLDLSDNDLRDEGVESLAVAIGQQDNCQIRKLILSDNKIDDSGATALAEMLFINHSITSIDLRRKSAACSRYLLHLIRSCAFSHR